MPFRASKAPSGKNSERMGPICFWRKVGDSHDHFPNELLRAVPMGDLCGCFQGADFRSKIDANDVRWLACRFENRSVNNQANAHFHAFKFVPSQRIFHAMNVRPKGDQLECTTGGGFVLLKHGDQGLVVDFPAFDVARWEAEAARTPQRPQRRWYKPHWVPSARAVELPAKALATKAEGNRWSLTESIQQASEVMPALMGGADGIRFQDERCVGNG